MSYAAFIASFLLLWGNLQKSFCSVCFVFQLRNARHFQLVGGPLLMLSAVITACTRETERLVQVISFLERYGLLHHLGKRLKDSLLFRTFNTIIVLCYVVDLLFTNYCLIKLFTLGCAYPLLLEN